MNLSIIELEYLSTLYDHICDTNNTNFYNKINFIIENIYKSKNMQISDNFKNNIYNLCFTIICIKPVGHIILDQFFNEHKDKIKLSEEILCNLCHYNSSDSNNINIIQNLLDNTNKHIINQHNNMFIEKLLLKFDLNKNILRPPLIIFPPRDDLFAAVNNEETDCYKTYIKEKNKHIKEYPLFIFDSDTRIHSNVKLFEFLLKNGANINICNHKLDNFIMHLSKYRPVILKILSQNIDLYNFDFDISQKNIENQNIFIIIISKILYSDQELLNINTTNTFDNNYNILESQNYNKQIKHIYIELLEKLLEKYKHTIYNKDDDPINYTFKYFGIYNIKIDQYIIDMLNYVDSNSKSASKS